MKTKEVKIGIIAGIGLGIFLHLASLACSFITYDIINGYEGMGIPCFFFYFPTVAFWHNLPKEITETIPLLIGHIIILAIIGGIIGWLVSKKTLK